MYEQVEKPKQNKSRAVANSVGQKKRDGQQGFGFVDNRLEAVAQRRLKGVVNNSQLDFDGRSSDPIQRMYVPPHRGGDPATLTPRQQRINAVQAAIAAPDVALPAATGLGILVFHPPVPGATWEYTRTVEYIVPVPGLALVTVRGHIHYTNSTGAVGPGQMWIGGDIVPGYSFTTPDAVVANFNAMPPAEAREVAVQEFNTRHRTTHNTL